jgi:hypothetical protein
MRSMKRFRILVAVGLVLATMLMMAPHAEAFIFINCRAAAQAFQDDSDGDGIYDWDIVMLGECRGDFQGPYALFGVAEGTSEGLGLCSGDLLVTNLDLDAELFLSSAKGPAFSKLLLEHWTAPITTYPVATPFLIEDVADPDSPTLVGAGVLSQHLGLRCNGSPGAAVFTVRLTS